MEISFVNSLPFPCSCSVDFSDGGGEYSDVITIKLCSKHSPLEDPTADAEADYFRSAAGSWVRR